MPPLFCKDMIVLEPGANTIVATLNEKKTLASPVYVFMFQNESNLKWYACTNTDASAFPTRYNEFTITVKTSPNWENGEVNLNGYGTYRYYAFEVEDTSGINYTTLINAAKNAESADDLVPTYFTTLVERGMMKYISEEESHNYYKNVKQPINQYGN